MVFQVVSYSISTSNHNPGDKFNLRVQVVSYSISTSNHNTSRLTLTLTRVVSYSISTSNHNLRWIIFVLAIVVSYSISTSNHNSLRRRKYIFQLYLIPFLHQTTTLLRFTGGGTMLYLIPFLHQTTTVQHGIPGKTGCILFHFYIKPQRYYGGPDFSTVVSYSISTSNHNLFVWT